MSSPLHLDLLESVDLRLTLDPALAEMPELWLPRTRRPVGGAESRDELHPRRISIRVRRGKVTDPLPAADPGFTVGRARGWVDPDAGRAVVAGERHGIRGSAHLRDVRGRVAVPPDAVAPALPERLVGAESGGPRFPADALRSRPEHPAWELSSVLSALSVLLLGRQGCTRVHGGAAVPPDGERAWLVVGDGRSGKSSVCAALVAAGWDYLSDDQLVLGEAGGGVMAEGWSEGLRLDEGWWDGEPTGRRRAVPAPALGPGRWRPTAPVGGLVLPRVEPDGSTGAEPATAGDALAALVRQSPWLMADPAASEALLPLLQRIARRPAAHLRLGADAFGDPEPILGALSAEGLVTSPAA